MEHEIQQHTNQQNTQQGTIVFDHVSFAYEPHQADVVRDISLSIPRGSFMVIVGPSGGGKSTLLRLIARLDHPQKGSVTNPLRTRMIFQGGALLPWETVLENVLIGLIDAPAGQKLSRKQKEERARAALTDLGIEDLVDQYPRHLSGGQRQRVGIARALVSAPELMLLDEPFSALDIETTERLSAEVLRIWQEQHMTMIMVSHSVEDAVMLADRILVFKDNHIGENVTVSVPRPRHHDDPQVAALVKRVQGMIPGSG